jgi:hypothetical protein
VTFIPVVDTTEIRLGNVNPAGDGIIPVCHTYITKNNRGDNARVTTEFAPGVPAETETVPGTGAWKKGEILCQHQMHDGRGIMRLAMSGVVDSADELAWVIDSSTTSPSGSAGQNEAAPVVVNVGEANGAYYVLYRDRLKIKRGNRVLEKTLDQLMDGL